MFYCENCKKLSLSSVCEICGRELREADGQDPVLLCEQDCVWSGLVHNILQDNGISFLTRSDLGAGLAAEIGSAFEHTQFFVPAAQYDKATELITILFSPTEGDIGESDPE